MKHLLALGAAALVASLFVVGNVHAATATAAPAWRTYVIATDRDGSEYGHLALNLGTNAERATGLRVKVTSTAKLKGWADVSCETEKLGDTAARHLEVAFPASTTTRGLPVPIKGGRCQVSVNLYSHLGGGQAAAFVQVQS